MYYVIFFIGFIFIILGLVLTTNNARYLLAGYNTMSENERLEVDIASLVKFFRKFHLFLGLTFVPGGLAFTVMIGEKAGTLFIAVYPVLGYIYFLVQSRKYATGAYAKYNRVGIYFLIISLFFIVLLFVSEI